MKHFLEVKVVNLEEFGGEVEENLGIGEEEKVGEGVGGEVEGGREEGEGREGGH